MNREEYNSAQEYDLMLSDSIRAGIWTAIPALIESVDYTKFTVSAQPAIKGVMTNSENETEYVSMPLLVDVPLIFPSAGGWHLTFPVKKGDECLVIFAARCIDAWWQNGGEQQPMEQRMLDLSDGFALLAPYSQPKAKEVSEGISQTSVILRDSSKQNYIELTNDGCANVLLQKDLAAEIKGNAACKIGGNLTAEIKGNADCNISGNLTSTVKGNANLQISGNLSANASRISLSANDVTISASNTTITGNLSVGGNMNVSGSTKATGSITCTGEVTGSGIKLSNHVHGGVEGGPSKTSGPE